MGQEIRQWVNSKFKILCSCVLSCNDSNLLTGGGDLGEVSWYMAVSRNLATRGRAVHEMTGEVHIHEQLQHITNANATQTAGVGFKNKTNVLYLLCS